MVNRYLSRKSFVSTLGAAGFGLTAATLGRAPSAMAQDEVSATEEGPAEEFHDFSEKKVEIYNAFTAALAEELNVASADEVDGAIRIALMAVIDDHVSEDGLTAGQAEALKVLVATSDVPIPAIGLGGGHAMVTTRGPGGPGFGMGGHHAGFGPGGGRGHVIARRRKGMGDDREFVISEAGVRAGEGADTPSDDEE